MKIIWWYKNIIFHDVCMSFGFKVFVFFCIGCPNCTPFSGNLISVWYLRVEQYFWTQKKLLKNAQFFFISVKDKKFSYKKPMSQTYNKNFEDITHPALKTLRLLRCGKGLLYWTYFNISKSHLFLLQIY